MATKENEVIVTPLNSKEFGESIYGQVIVSNKSISRAGIEKEKFATAWEQFWKLNALPEYSVNTPNGFPLEAYRISPSLLPLVQPEAVRIDVSASRTLDFGIKKVSATDIMNPKDFNDLQGMIVSNLKGKDEDLVPFVRPKAISLGIDLTNYMSLTGERVKNEIPASIIILNDSAIANIGIDNYRQTLEEHDVIQIALRINEASRSYAK